VTSTLTLPLARSKERVSVDFDGLYRSARDDVFAYVATLLRDRAAAEDVAALAFERAFRKQRSYDARKGSERQWLFGIARHAALDELRRRSRAATPMAEPMATGLVGTVSEGSSESDRAVARATVEAGMAALGARDREIIALKFHAGLDNAEIAAVLGVTPTNAGTLLHRAMTKLREAIDAQ
jgi:RNA polymerase sigma-70 factor (ECF subfamily)